MTACRKGVCYFHSKYLQPINMCDLKDQVKIPLGTFNFVAYFFFLGVKQKVNT